MRNTIKKQLKHTGEIDFKNEGLRIRVFENVALRDRAASRILVGISGVISGKLKVPDQAARSIC